MNKQELIDKYEKKHRMVYTDYQGAKVIAEMWKDIKQLDQPQKVTVPQFVADWYEANKDDFETNLFRAVDLIPSDYEEGELSCFEEWLVDEHTKPFQTLVNMHQFGYTVEKEKRYLVKMKGISSNMCYLNCIGNERNWIISDKTEYNHIITEHTRKELEEAGFGDVFNSPLFEVEEWKNDSN